MFIIHNSTNNVWIGVNDIYSGEMVYVNYDGSPLAFDDFLFNTSLALNRLNALAIIPTENTPRDFMVPTRKQMFISK